MPEKVRTGPVADGVPAAELGLALGQLQLFAATQHRGGTWQGPGTWCLPEPQSGGARGSVAFAEGGEMPFSQQCLSLTH